MKNKEVISILIQTFKEFLKNDSVKKLLGLFMQLKKTNNKEAVTKVLWNIHKMFEDHLKNKSPFENKLEYIVEKLSRVEKEADIFEKSYLIVDKQDLLSFKSFQLFVIFAIEYLIKTNLYYYYQMPFYRVSYQDKVKQILTEILGNQKHIGHRRAISELFGILESWKEKKSKMPIDKYMDTIREFHGLSKNLEVIDLSDVWQTLQKLRDEITLINELHSPAIDVLKEEQRLLGNIRTLGVGPNKNEIARSIVNSLIDKTEDGFRLDAFGIVFSIVEQIKNEEKIDKILENIIKVNDALSSKTKKFKTYSKELDEDWDEITEKLNLYRVNLFLDFKRLKQIFGDANKKPDEENKKEDDLKDKKQQKDSKDDKEKKDNKKEEKEKIDKVGEIYRLEYYFKKLNSYIERDLERQITVAKLFNDEKKKFITIQKSGKLELIEAQKRKLLAIQKKHKMILQKANFKKTKKENGNFVVTDTASISDNKDLVSIRNALVKSINYFYDFEGELVSNIKRLRGETSKDASTSIVGLIELLNKLWNKKDALLQTKLKFLRSFAQEKDERIIDDFNNVMKDITYNINKDHYIYFPFDRNIKYFGDIPNNHLDEIKKIIIRIFNEKKSSQSAVKKFFDEFNFEKEMGEVEFHKAIRYLERIHLFDGKEETKQKLEEIHRDYLDLKDQLKEEKEIIEKSKSFTVPTRDENLTNDILEQKDTPSK